ncbi:coproporphyrinogen dehydrogenase HemZ [Proteinivorax hydrogeniformans]|uniref:Coproporphyrinogen dehydrogenase HemZ n=1 Tax=Proteinivorax hydrogeniformans TaxID=1826727 RepID=A0AAU8HS47_9FIRM
MLSIYCNVDPRLQIVAHNILLLITSSKNIYYANSENFQIDIEINISKVNNSFLIELTKGDKSFTLTEEIAALNEKFTLRKALFKALEKATKKRPSPWGILTGIRPIKLISNYLNSNLEDPISFLQNELLVSKDKVDLCLQVVNNQKKITTTGINLYIGIPFCPSRCSYCSFTSYTIDKNKDMVDPYLKTLILEMEYISKVIKKQKLKIGTVYIGGGTPTSLSDSQLKLLLKSIQSNFDNDRIKEFTLEGGRPDTLTLSKMKLAKSFGVNRLSINCQSLNPQTLQNVNRNHTALEFVEAIKKAKSIGFDWINTDLIYGLDGEGLLDFISSLNKTISLEPENITIHSLAVKRAADLKSHNSYHKEELEKGLSQVYNILKKAKYQPYYLYRQKAIAANLENTGFAKDGKISPYNVASIEESSTILALGCGAVSKIMTKNGFSPIQNPKDPNQYKMSLQKLVNQKSSLLEKK